MSSHSMLSRVRAPMHNDGDDSHNFVIHGRNLNNMGGHGCNLKGKCQALIDTFVLVLGLGLNMGHLAIMISACKRLVLLED